ncbi:unnamed protein product [Phaedon cochleariae]|uniref:Protein deadpan n=1 Tax=Phaedon cochleariae TaxID=80249 RepID=A0A9P0DQP1_PHACE|nr:unnamed protein product [Phaedon cochleariae]
MPISEDEFEYGRSQEPQSTMSKAELRKTHKPIMEKRRRARINHCLNEIKSLILEAMNKDPSRHSKLEKADILEMAVKHLQNVQRQQLALAMATDPSVIRKFKSGFDECASEIDRYIGQVEGSDGAMKQRVSSHLQKCIGGIEQVAQFNFPGFNNLPLLSSSSNRIFTTPQEPANPGDKNNSPRIQIPQGIQLIPSRLPSGELALLVPNSSNMPYFPANIAASVQQRPSAFATVMPQPTSTDQLIPKPLSPPMSPIRQEDIRIRNPSPHGFRPVIPSNKRAFSDDHQVPQISSSTVAGQPLEVKTLRFPINNKKMDSPKKLGEPLCIITNQSERHKQAQMKEDSANFEENIVQQGLKRKYSESLGLLTVASTDVCYPVAPKIIKTHLVTPTLNLERETNSSADLRKAEFHYVSVIESIRDNEAGRRDGQPSGSRDNNNFEGNNDMWRPW